MYMYKKLIKAIILPIERGISMKLKKFFYLSSAVASMFLLSGCTKDSQQQQEPGIRNYIKTIEQKEKSEFYNLSQPKIISVNDENINLTTIYFIEMDKSLKEFILGNQNQLGLEIRVSDSEKFDFYLNRVETKIKLVYYKNSQYNGIVQDSLSLDYSDLDNDGILIDAVNEFNYMFDVGNINQADDFIQKFNQNGNSDSDNVFKINEAQGELEGIKITTIWTILVKEKETGKVYLKNINHDIFLENK